MLDGGLLVHLQQQGWEARENGSMFHQREKLPCSEEFQSYIHQNELNEWHTYYWNALKSELTAINKREKLQLIDQVKKKFKQHTQLLPSALANSEFESEF